jgi:aminotransferase in exopolysaccharide biosynthesis
MKNVPDQRTMLARQIAEAIATVVGSPSAVLHEPEFKGREWLYVKDCLDSTFVSSVGEYVDRFEAELASFTGARHAVAVVNGTAALHIALKLAGVQAGEEVLVPALTFIATANAVSYCDAVPHFVDSEERTLGVDPYALREYLGTATERHSGSCINKATGKLIRAMVPMHAFGHPLDIEALLAVAHDFGLQLIEDAAESLGSTRNGRQTGTFGLMGTLSFNGNKTITTGGGGAILFNDTALAKQAKHLTTTAKLQHRWEYEHDAIGYNYRLPNINAALGCAQLEQLPAFIEKKRRLFERYDAAFRNIRGVRVFSEPDGCRSNYWLQTLLLDKVDMELRNQVLALVNDSGYGCRPAWKLMHRLKPYKDCPNMPLPVAEAIEKRLINIPSSARLGTNV